MPDWRLEESSPAPVAGVDEVGRGCLAGEVVAAAVIFPSRNLTPLLAGGIRDSKQLLPARRRLLAEEIHRSAWVGIGTATVTEIDRLNILQASLLAMSRAVAALPSPPAFALVDGRHLPPLACPCLSVIKGDSRSYSIAAASIVAKTHRDRMMQALHEGYPRYGWGRNAGYPTTAHRAALNAHGVTPHHRHTFAPVRAALSVQDAL